MRLNLIQYISKAGNYLNEDCISFGDAYGLILDGSTGLRKNIIPNADSDAKWFVDGFKEYILKNIDLDLPLPDIIKKCICEMSARLISYDLGVIDKIDQPSASIAIIKEKGDDIEIFSLGDCTILLEAIDGKINIIYDDSVSKLDKVVIKKMVQLSNEKNISISLTRKLVEEDLIRNRYMKNTKEGYWILGFDEIAVEHGYYKKWKSKDLKRICIYSDGFSDFYESMNIANGYNEFFKMLTTTDVRDMYFTLREEQDKDAECNIHPRLKYKDDASVLLFEIDNKN